MIDSIYDAFTRSVATHRGISQQSIKNTEARLYLGKDAITAGLADGVSTMAELKSRLRLEKTLFLSRALWEKETQRRLQHA